MPGSQQLPASQSRLQDLKTRHSLRMHKRDICSINGKPQATTLSLLSDPPWSRDTLDFGWPINDSIATARGMFQPTAEGSARMGPAYDLPDLNSFCLRLEELVTRLDVEGFVECIEIADRTIGSERRR